MPKAATTSRNPLVPSQRAVRRSTGAERSLPQPIGTLPGSEAGGLEPTSQRPMNIREVPGRTSYASRTLNQDDRDENFELVHANCKKTIENAVAINRQLTARFNEKRREIAANAQRFSRERSEMMTKIQQYSLEIQKQSGEVQRLNGEVTRLETLLETANSNARNLLSRSDLQQTLEDIHTAGQSFMSHLKTRMNENEIKMDENENAQNFSQLPGIDVTGDWPDTEAFDVINDSGAFAEMPATMFPASDQDGVPNI
ncbi:uncharacterized protein N7515_001202 [Penicillium bovifimosum]|uniref:Uncharacterized protein n=1 Tax=Penicillium bovifimosum TaxID=126998 RepID=A0A9W9HHC1_9EURO|nr:uncharacterized protein N7515_001202 [Penicillium bovifimosum]KAJ5146638.1 hypothetical protein N7515_001202 [Penicillium bovifimosum]